MVKIKRVNLWTFLSSILTGYLLYRLFATQKAKDKKKQQKKGKNRTKDNWHVIEPYYVTFIIIGFFFLSNVCTLYTVYFC